MQFEFRGLVFEFAVGLGALFVALVELSCDCWFCCWIGGCVLLGGRC